MVDTEKRRWTLDLPVQLQDRADQAINRYGLTRTSAVERLLSWWIQQDPVIQQWTLSQLPERMAAGIRVQVSIPAVSMELKQPQGPPATNPDPAQIVQPPGRGSPASRKRG